MWIDSLVKIGVTSSQAHFFLMGKVESWWNALLCALLVKLLNISVRAFFESSPVVLVVNWVCEEVLEMIRHILLFVIYIIWTLLLQLYKGRLKILNYPKPSLSARNQPLVQLSPRLDQKETKNFSYFRRDCICLSWNVLSILIYAFNLLHLIYW